MKYCETRQVPSVDGFFFVLFFLLLFFGFLCVCNEGIDCSVSVSMVDVAVCAVDVFHRCESWGFSCDACELTALSCRILWCMGCWGCIFVCLICGGYFSLCNVLRLF